jgi:hypothetical protein
MTSGKYAFRPIVVVSGGAFLLYGAMCLFSASMASDLHRFGLDELRVFTGVLDSLGGIGLLVGLKWAPAFWVSSAGLAMLILIAFCIRLHMHDSVAISAFVLRHLGQPFHLRQINALSRHKSHATYVMLLR